MVVMVFITITAPGFVEGASTVEQVLKLGGGGRLNGVSVIWLVEALVNKDCE